MCMGQVVLFIRYPMGPEKKAELTTFTGEIVEMMEKNGQQVATVALGKSHIEVKSGLPRGLHLGDPVVIEAIIEIRAIGHKLPKTLSGGEH
jgi:hypothetical protein